MIHDGPPRSERAAERGAREGNADDSAWQMFIVAEAGPPGGTAPPVLGESFQRAFADDVRLHCSCRENPAFFFFFFPERKSEPRSGSQWIAAKVPANARGLELQDAPRVTQDASGHRVDVATGLMTEVQLTALKPQNPGLDFDRRE